MTYKNLKIFALYIVALMLTFFTPHFMPAVNAHTTSVTIKMTKDGFVPKEMSLDTNSSVVFENADSADHWPASDIHPTHTIYPEFDPKRPITPGISWTFNPKRSGQFSYHDHLNPEDKGVLSVIGETEENLSGRGQSSIKPYEQDLAENIDRILLEKRFRLKDKDENVDTYIRNQMDICYKSGGRDSCYSDLAYILIYQFSLRDILDLIAKNQQVIAVFSRCHELTHFLTRLAYKKEKNIPKIYEQCTSVCHGGCYHGGIEQYLSEKQLLSKSAGFDKVQEEIPKLCGQRADYQIPLLYDECLHGIGHGTMYVTEGDLPKALSMCDNLSQSWERETCYSGAFMENSSSSTNLDHPSKFIKADDPMYPCNILDKKYLNICYRYQSSHFAIISGSNWTETAKLCLKVPKEYQMPCFLTIGSNQVGASQDLEKIKNNCNLMPEDQFKNFCFQGAVDALAIRYRDDPSWGFNFCQKLDANFQKDCLTQYGRSISSWSKDAKNLEKLCGSLDSTQLRSWCMGQKSSIIKITKNGFEPIFLSVEREALIQFKNEDSKDHWPASDIHPTHEIYPEFDPQKPIKSGEVWEFRVEKRGIFKFHDHLFPHLGGSIEVIGGDNISGDSLIGAVKSFWQKFWSNFLNSLKKGLSAYQKLLPKGDDLKDLKKMADLEGVETAWKYLISTYQNDPGEMGKIHDLAHFLGGLIFERKGFSGLSTCSPNFAFGCFHGFLDYAFKDNLEKLTEAQKACANLGQGGPFASCIHGIGHGVASFYKTVDLKGALTACDKLSIGREYCHDGVFMEFGRNASPNFYKASDPLYPCNQMEGIYIFSCGRNQVRVMLDRLGLTFEQVGQICTQSNDQNFQMSCFDAIGFQTVAQSAGDWQKISSLCFKITTEAGKVRCIKSAAGELIFQDIPGWQESSTRLCQSLSADFQRACFEYLEQIKRDYGR